jgi:hypothetical protein
MRTVDSEGRKGLRLSRALIDKKKEYLKEIYKTHS